ncbi:Txe/YoeB family addiction module toxin [Qipengyuania spongiae]|uniref:Putative mRNA interferase YoeB n=1 Tax=Qipengyuania spongiae TaxID=2909673 RepID=A0ABY5SYK2_9SPHN|nr:Txe/YoeB family addiction module toxin [Qipengyuania spongiae]UVI38091.1 Txe/YoeB family addiction module toxin [Qipengyuania spongiae]
MQLLFDRDAWADYLFWQDRDRKLLKRINRMIKECQRTPYEGIGKPEPLKEDLSGYWSRRITDEHRLVYRVVGKGDTETFQIAQCRYHYR